MKKESMSHSGSSSSSENISMEKTKKHQPFREQFESTADEPQKRYWLFQYRPEEEESEWLTRARAGEPVDWRISRFRDEMQIGDDFFVWRAFKDADERKHHREASGLVGRGTISHVNFEDRGNHDLRLSLPVDEWFDQTLSRDQLAEKVNADEFPFLRVSTGTVFSVPETVAAKIVALLGNIPEQLSNMALIQSDQPAEHDSFNRAPFAEYLARWMDRLWQEQNRSAVKSDSKFSGDSFVMHLCGRWGAGKTTFMRQMGDCLNDASKMTCPWNTIHFNAWRNQHVVPPWWGLLDSIIAQGIDHADNRDELRRKSYLYRIEEGDRRFALFSIIAVMVILVVALTYGNGVIELLASVFALGSTVALFLSRLMPGFSSTAHLFQRFSSDPMGRIRSYYDRMIRSFEHPVIVFIDDLDRCKSSYVIELLESLHTLYSHPRVFFVVAADRNWLSACFEAGYDTFNGKIAQLEQPTGYRFLEKLFQLSIALPPISPDLKLNFLDEITASQAESKAEDSASEAAFQKLAQQIEQASSETELNELLGRHPDNLTRKKDIIAAAVIKAAKTESFTRANRHRLSRFIDLMEPNPRSMKLIVNAFGVYVNLIRTSGMVVMDELFLNQVALWTVLEVRFPRVAEYLSTKPSKITCFAKGKLLMNEDDQLPDMLHDLIGNRVLMKIATGFVNNTGEQIPALSEHAINVIANGEKWKE